MYISTLYSKHERARQAKPSQTKDGCQSELGPRGELAVQVSLEELGTTLACRNPDTKDKHYK